MHFSLQPMHGPGDDFELASWQHIVIMRRSTVIHVLYAGIGVCIALILYIALFGGGKFEFLGVTLKCTGLKNPIALLVTLSLLRWFVAVGLKNSLMVIVSLVVALALGEGLLRMVNPDIALPSLKETVEPSPVLGYRMIPGLKARGIQTNSHGLRDVERPWAKPQNVNRILGIGDSFTFGYRVDLSECYLKQLESRLNRSGERWDVINAGVSGYNMWQYLGYLQNYGMRYGAELVIVGVFFDDFKGAPSDAGKPPAAKKPASPDSLKIANLFKNCTELFSRRLHFIGSTWLNSIEERRKYILNTRDRLILTGEAAPELYNGFESRLAEMSRIAASKGAAMIVLWIPDIIQLNHPELQVVNGMTSRICARCGVKFLDMTSVFESRPDVKGLYLMPFDAHTSPEGHRIIAEQLERAITGHSRVTDVHFQRPDSDAREDQ